MKVLSLVLALISLSACTKTPVADLRITNVGVIDAADGLRELTTVVVNDGVITYVGPIDNAPVATIEIDGRDRFLIPGLWDMHVHLTYDDRFTETMPETFVRYGITSVRDTGGLLDKLKPVIAEMRAPGAIAPRVKFSGPLLDGGIVVYDGQSVPEIGVSNQDAESARAQVAALAAEGVDFLKIYEMVSPDVFRAIVDAAEVHQLPIAAHVPLSMRAREAGPSVDSLEHLRNIELDCAEDAADLATERQSMLGNPDNLPGIQLRSNIHSAQRDRAMAAFDASQCNSVIEQLSATIQVPTLRLNAINHFLPFNRDDWSDALATLPDDVREAWREPPKYLVENVDQSFVRSGTFSLSMVEALSKAGVPIGAGTDTPIFYAVPGYSLHNELEILVAAGLSTQQALASATTVPASFFGIEQQIGRIQHGMLADLVLLRDNPLEDIRATKTIEHVILRGALVESSGQ